MKNRYTTEFVEETASTDAYHQVKKNGEFLACFPTHEKASQYIDDCKHTVILRTRRIDSYFRGILKYGYFPLDGYKWFVACQSYSGGRMKLSFLLDVKADSERSLIYRLHSFKRKHKLILERI